MRGLRGSCRQWWLYLALLLVGLLLVGVSLVPQWSFSEQRLRMRDPAQVFPAEGFLRQKNS